MPSDRLTPRQEHDLVIGAEAGDADASRKLVEAFLPAIVGVAAHFPTAVRVERQELVQEGVAGLLFAARRYDTSLETPFWAYASFWVRKSMQELVAELARPVALSDRAVRGLALLGRARSEYLQAHGSEPTDGELSRATGLTRTQIESLQATQRRPRALEEPLDGAAEAVATVGDTIVDPVAEREYEQVLDEIEIDEVRDLADELDHFIKASLSGKPYLQDYREAFDAVPVLDALAQSARTGFPVDVLRDRPAMVDSNGPILL